MQGSSARRDGARDGLHESQNGDDAVSASRSSRIHESSPHSKNPRSASYEGNRSIRPQANSNLKEASASRIDHGQSRAKGACPVKLTHIKTLRRALNKAKALGYISVLAAKNKDTSAWTQPKDPLLVKIEELQQRSNIYGEEQFTQEYESIEAEFLSSGDQCYAENYAED